MKTVNVVATSAVMLALVGCQSSTQEGSHAQANQAQTNGYSHTNGYEHSNHMSQSVYEVEYLAAKNFAQQADQLSKAFGVYCDNQSSEDAIKNQWHQTMLAWMALQGQERGPEKALEQSWNIQFWPDKKNTTGRKMAAMTSQSQSWSPQEVSQQSVTVQGLGSIEWLLYDSASPLKGSESVCHTGYAITQNLANNANIISTSWQENPWNELDEKHWRSEYISLLSNQLEYSMKKMSRPLANFGKPRPYFSESWRSETSMQNLKANIAAMQSLYFAQGSGQPTSENADGLDQILRESGKHQLADSITKQFELMLETWPTEQSLFDLLKTKEGTKTAYAQYNKLEHLNYLIREEVAIELGIVIGFNATDGD
ncbi:iron-regulated protein A [Vibrio sp. ZSDE26]|uniref:Iron-regulated protein A n=1 Tax=Vibrio amylolyticus TaxID=2847292 RepID=A0A9X2BHL5_9VIBR|nr:imelysin family protein [Vibrio amylolyticus]MCK6264111.1 iron-regulated protein A [Vibrio amylolyticus]